MTRRRADPITGLSAEAMSGMTPEQISARWGAAAERAAASDRRLAASRLAEMVAAIPPPKRPAPKAKPAKSARGPQATTASASAPSKSVVIPLPKGPRPPRSGLGPEDLAVLDRVIAAVESSHLVQPATAPTRRYTNRQRF